MLNSNTDKEQFRLLMQWWGTEFRRNMVDKDYWIKKVQSWIDKHPEVDVILIPDLRFKNEIEWIKKTKVC